jgi:hypothetical protein
MTPPTLRSIVVNGRDAPNDRHWRCALVRLGEGKSIFVEKHITSEGPNCWYVYLNKYPLSEDAQHICPGEHQRTDHIMLDEFAAQGVFDHYVQTYGLAP